MGKISDFMNSLNPDTFNCVFSTNGMTLLTDEQYNYRLEEIHTLKQEKRKLQQELNKYKSIVEELKKMLQKEIVDGRDEEHLWLMGCYDEAKEILDQIKKLEEGDK